jgi:predicted Zn finger-like uncharacterized protein
MTITVSCPSCETSFPVDPAKVPPEGVRAQCSVCPEIFDVDRPNGATPPVSEPLVDAFDTVDPLEAGAVDLPGIDGSFEPTDYADTDSGGDGGFEQTEDYATGDVAIDIGPIEPPPAEVVEDVAEEVGADEPAADVGEASAESPGPIRFGRRSPEDKARSLARSLVSDLIAYNPEKHKEALATETLEEVFGEEIEKSLKEYQEQVEPDVMSKGSFFNDALNSILAEGQSIFTLDD